MHGLLLTSIVSCSVPLLYAAADSELKLTPEGRATDMGDFDEAKMQALDRISPLNSKHEDIVSAAARQSLVLQMRALMDSGDQQNVFSAPQPARVDPLNQGAYNGIISRMTAPLIATAIGHAPHFENSVKLDLAQQQLDSALSDASWQKMGELCVLHHRE